MMVKMGFFGGRAGELIHWEGRREKKRVIVGKYNLSIFYICVCVCVQNSIMKPSKSCFKRGRKSGELRKNNSGMNLIKVNYMTAYKYHKETPLYNQYVVIKSSLSCTLKLSVTV
jgi:hypothetical protein